MGKVGWESARRRARRWVVVLDQLLREGHTGEIVDNVRR